MKSVCVHGGGMEVREQGQKERDGHCGREQEMTMRKTFAEFTNKLLQISWLCSESANSKYLLEDLSEDRGTVLKL